MSDIDAILCYDCWNQSRGRYGRSCSLLGIENPRKATCDRFVYQCRECGAKCVLETAGIWVCTRCIAQFAN